ncbi:MAG: TIGR04551 family protein [Polyangiaceae bacterium]|nr:TIGR04551 family protein [Polyangiaceae bacterium]
MLLLPAVALAQPAPAGDQPTDTPEPPPPPPPEATESTGQPAPTAPAPLDDVAPPPAAAPPLAQPGVGSTLGPSEPSSSTAAASDAAPAADPNQVFAEDWWQMARPVFEFHGYFRMRAELFHNFSLGRFDAPGEALWAQPPDHSYNQWSADGQVAPHNVPLCGENASHPAARSCTDKSQASANVRFRLNPEVHVSDNLRILSQIDMLDNLVLGSTPEGYANVPSANGGFMRSSPSGYAPTGAFQENQVPPSAGVNSARDSIRVKRVWGEYVTPIGQLRFGRMPSHWGLGILENAGDGFDSDYQSTVDRVMFVTGIRAWDMYFAGAWDLPGEGATSENFSEQQGQAYDLAQLDDVNQYVVMLMRRKAPALQRLALSRGDVVLNGGMYFAYRTQFLANDDAAPSATAQTIGADPDSIREGYQRRNAKMMIPDLWLQLLYKKFRFELEAVMMRGSMETTPTDGYINRSNPDENGWKVRQYGLATQTEYTTVEDRLRLNFGFGWASGDPDVVGPKVAGLTPGYAGFQRQQTTDRTFSTFRFHPDYRVDLILHRHVLSRVQGTYYFRPAVEYDFARSPNGQKFGGGASVIWSRASEFVQAPGHRRDLGIEINLNVYFQSKDGSLNDNPDEMGGLFTMLQYGVLFPLGGLGYLPGQEDQAREQNVVLDTSAAQTLRWYAGIFF